MTCYTYSTKSSSFPETNIDIFIDTIQARNLEAATWTITLLIEATYRYPMTWESLCEDYCKYGVSMLIATRQAQ